MVPITRPVMITTAQYPVGTYNYNNNQYPNRLPPINNFYPSNSNSYLNSKYQNQPPPQQSFDFSIVNNPPIYKDNTQVQVQNNEPIPVLPNSVYNNNNNISNKN